MNINVIFKRNNNRIFLEYADFKFTYPIQHDNQQPVLKQVVQNNLPKLDEIW